MIKRLLIVAGGTGGHVFPALVIARCLRDQGVEVVWLGTKKGLEAQIISSEKIPFHSIAITGLRGKSFFQWLLAPWRLLVAFFQSMWIVWRCQPDVVLAMGGFVSGPGGLAAWILNKRLVIHEQNAIAGLTNRILARFASTILTTFPNTSGITCSQKKAQRMIYTGLPIRQEIALLPAPAQRFAQHDDAMHLLVIGGSQGALSFNQVIPQALSKLILNKPLNVWHQAGQRYQKEAEQAYHHYGLVDVHLEPFIHDMSSAYAWADLVICRAGASTVTELTAVGLGSIIIPYPYAVDDHQDYNAHFLVEAEAALCLSQSELNAERLAYLLSELMKDKDRLLKMAEAARSLRKINVAQSIIEVL